jgi:ubiquinone/menaquinone biosynthesis C-methylase UbiE
MNAGGITGESLVEAAERRLEFTGERMVPGKIEVQLFRECEDRYNFAAPLVKNKSVVDVACGVGMGSQLLLDAGATSVIGVDYDSAALEYARGHFEGCTFVACDAQHLLLQDDSADVIVSFETIEHVPDPIKFLKECRRVLKPRGLFICSTPNHAVYRWWGVNPFHNREFLPNEFLETVGSFFAEVEAYGQKTVFYPTFVAKRVIADFLERANLKSTLMLLLGRKPAPISDQKRFTLNRHRLTREIKPYGQNWIDRPTFLLIVCRKL